MQQKKVLETQLSKRLETTKPNQVFAPDMKRAKDGVAQLTTRVNALPKTPAFEPFRDRLTSIDNQFQSTTKLVNSIKGTETPQQLMGIQSQLYQMSENLELMSKALEQLTSGVKSILQTQI
jgi:methyl-accepting chemotaxis protein